MQRTFKPKDVEYIAFNEKHTVRRGAVLFDPINKMHAFDDSTILESPNFLLTRSFHQEMYDNKKGKDSIRFTTYFYPRAKAHLNVLHGVENTDKLNRETLKTKVVIPQFPKQSKENDTYLQEAMRYVETHFKSNYGQVENFNFPIDTETAFRWLTSFITHRFKHFGTSQDAIVEGESMLYHSGLS